MNAGFSPYHRSMIFEIASPLVAGAYRLSLDRYRTTKDRNNTGEREFGERWDMIAQGEVGALVIARHLRSLGFKVRANRNIEYIQTRKGVVSTDGEVDLQISLDGVKWISLSIKVSTWPCRGKVPFSRQEILDNCDFKVFVHKNLEEDFRADVAIQGYYPANTKASNHMRKEDWAAVTEWLREHPEPTDADIQEALRLVHAAERYTTVELFGFTTLDRVKRVYKETPPPYFHESLPIESSNDSGRGSTKDIWWMRIGACSYPLDSLMDVLKEKLDQKVMHAG